MTETISQIILAALAAGHDVTLKMRETADGKSGRVMVTGGSA